MPRKKTTVVPTPGLSMYDWCFGSCPDEQALFCFAYEYAREIKSIRQAHAAAKQSGDHSQFDEHGNWHYPFVIPPKIEGGEIQMIILDAPPGFPDKPYLSLHHQKSRLGWRRPFSAPKSLILAKRQADGGFTSGDETEPLSARIFEDGRARSFIGTWKADELVHLYIDWDAAPTRILAEFSVLLEELRKKAGKRNNQIAKIHAELKALGAVRLLREHGTVRAAMNAVENEAGGKGRVYSNEPEWSRAKRVVARVTGDFRRHIRVEHEPTYFMTPYSPSKG